LLCAALVALALIGAAPAAAEPGEPTRDCVGDSMLDRGQASSIRFVVWCSTDGGRFDFELQRSDGGRENPVLPILAFSAHPQVSGAGAGRAGCRLGAKELRCHGRKSAQLVVRGRIVVPAGTRCAAKLRIATGFAISAGLPSGCPGSRPPRGDFDRGYMRGFRAQFGLLDGLEDDPAEISRRIDAAIANWRRGEPVARVTAAEIGMPLLPFEQRRLEFRDRLLDNVDALEAWVHEQPADTWAGYELVDGLRPILYVGFTGDQEAQLAAFKRAAKPFAPANIEPFPIQPLYTERQLWELGEAAIEPFGSALDDLVNSVGVAVLANKVEIGTEHVAKVERLLAEKYGPDAPFLVSFERGGTFL